MGKVRLAVVLPSVDKRHGTERRVAECISRLAEEFEIHLYSMAVEDVDLRRVHLHRVPSIPGPHLVGYLWWFFANHLWRWWDASIRGGRPDLVYSPGINCLDADAVTVHVVFSELRRQLGEGLSFRKNPPRFWPKLIHRRLYYRLIRALERRVYSRASLAVGAVSRKVAEELERHFGRKDSVAVIYQGIDHEVFNRADRLRRRQEMRRQFVIADHEFALLLIGNGWKNKGLDCLLEAMAQLADLPLRLLVAGRDDRAPYEARLRESSLQGRVRFLDPSADVVQFYAAADVYVGPSLQDSFAQPPAEAMACGLPVITSSQNGGSEIITHGVDGFILQDARDAAELARLIRQLCENTALRESVAREAGETAARLSWEHNAAEMRELFEEARRRKSDR